MNIREGFLKVLTDNEDDIPTRLVYADWLDEQGEHEEADRQRKWPAAKAWLVRLCHDNNQRPWLELEIPYKELLELGRQAVEKPTRWGMFGFDCGNNEDMCDALRNNSREFWKNWSIVTGIPLPPDLEEKGCFSCAC